MRKTFSQLNKVRMKIKIYDVLVGNYVKDDWYATIFERSLKIYFEYITLRWSPESFSHSFLLICLRERSDCNNILCLLFTHFLQNLHSHWVSPLKHIQFLLFFLYRRGYSSSNALCCRVIVERNPLPIWPEIVRGPGLSLLHRAHNWERASKLLFTAVPSQWHSKV